MDWGSKNVLITGVSGFVGSYLSSVLIEKGASVYGLIRKKADGSSYKNLTDRGVEKNITLIEGDLSEMTSLANALDISQPDYIFHLGAQSFVQRSFENSMETQQINTMGTANLLDIIRIKDYDSKIIFAGSSEEYGLVFSSKEQFENAKKEHGSIFPDPFELPEVPIKETNPLRPMSPYAVSKVYGDFLMRNYYHSYGLDTVVSRAFNHEGAGRGIMFVTSVITNQIMKYKFKEIDKIIIGNINAFRDWSHVKDIVNGYLLLADKGKSGEVYNQSSMRTNSILSYILLGLEAAGWKIEDIETFNGEKKINEPTNFDDSKIFGISFPKTKVDKLALEEDLEFSIKDKGINITTNDKKIPIEFDESRFRPAEVPILLGDCKKIEKLGFKTEYSLMDIINDQLNYYIDPANRI
ncbi:MAG: GDP-mannose 4,6-dehydratase [Methanobrevibacter sp.]|jgi:GDPmannose 4,6-dehydratase|nr:GDP-mannose 4,6-dehydratase [Methanobrevibacter sp.]